MTTGATSAIVSATMPTNAPVSRHWSVRGTVRGNGRRRPAPPRARSSASALGEGVAGTTNRHHELRRAGIVLDLVAQVADMHVDRLLVLVERLVVTKQLEELAAGEDAARATRQVAEDLELGGRQADPPVAAENASPLEVDHEVALPDDSAPGRGRVVTVRASEERLDPAHQLAQREGFRDVVVGAELEPDHLVELVITSGQEQDGCLRSRRPQPAQDLEAVDAGQADVEDEEIGRLRSRKLQAFLPRPRDRHLV